MRHAIQHRPPTRRAYTLLEVVIVVALIGLIAAVILTGFAGRSAGTARRQAVMGVIEELTIARMEALRTGKVRSARLVRVNDEDELVASRGERTRRWRAKGLEPRDSGGGVVTALEAVFDGAGRTDQRRWLLSVPDTSGGVAAGTMFRIEFDPVSGAVSLGRGDKEAVR